ncbi:hypothetical protein MMC18_008900 [Xylographa bjoerkii]|nr:hypothetical protein [Xylographa bjoerkii]
MVCTTQSLRDVDIRAVWDGVQGHAVHVDLCVRLECRPGTRFLVLDHSHELVESASVVRIRHVTPPVYEEPSNADNAQAIGDTFSTLDIDAFSPLDMDGLLQWDEKLAAAHQNQLALLYKDITSLESFSPVVAAERWKEIKESDVTLAVATESASLDENEILRANSRQSPAIEDRRPSSRQSCSPLTLSVRKRGHRAARADCRRGAGPTVPPLRKRSKSLSSDVLSPRGSVRTPEAASQHNIKTQQVRSSSAVALRSLGLVTATTGSTTHQHVLGVCDWMCPELSGFTDPLVRATPHNQTYRHAELNGGAINSRTDLISDETMPTVRPPSSNNAISYKPAQSSENVDCTASRSPERWMKHHDAERLDNILPCSDMCPVAPSWIKEDGKLYIVCEDNATTGTYEVDLKAKIRLPVLDAQHRQLFCIPGLIRAEVAQDRKPTGSFALYHEPSVDTSGGLAMRFESKTLMDCHIKESSHIIGRFRLDETPLISIRTKKPAHVISDFSASIEACAAFLPSIDSGVRRLYYNAKMICEVVEEDVWANKVEFFIVVRHGPSEYGQYYVNNGTCAVLHNTLLLSSGTKQSEALISILRDTEDMHNHLDVGFSLPIDVSTPKEVFLPTLRPLFGKVLSESIILGLPMLPLKLEHIEKNSHTTWKVLHCSEAGHQMMRFDRLPISDTLLQVMEDSPHFRVSELVRVLFRQLATTYTSQTEQNPVSVARKLRVTLFEILAGGLGCQIDVKVQIGKSSKILTIDPQRWLPSVSFIDGQLATEKHGEWRETDDTFLTLFNTRDMRVGKVLHITFFFQQSCSTPILEEDYEIIERDCNDEGVERPLPRIVGKTILQAVMKSELEKCTIILLNPLESRVSRFSRCRDHTEIRLPMLASDYHFSFIRDAPQPTTPPKEANMLETPMTDEEEQTVVVVEAVVNEAGKSEHYKVQLEDETQPQLGDIGSEHETTGTSFVVIDEASLGGALTTKTAGHEKFHGPGPGTAVKAMKADEWSSRSTRYRVSYYLVVYVCFPLCYLGIAYFVLGKPMTTAACVFFSDPCPLMTQRMLNGLQVNRRPTSPQVQWVESKMQPALGGHGSDIDASHNKVGEIRVIDREDRQGEVLKDPDNNQVQREKDAGVLDWIDHALGWKG